MENNKKFHHFLKYEEKVSGNQCLHPKIVKTINSFFPSELKNVKNNIIFYGPSGSGKYTLALKLIKRFSSSKLKYEKKILISSNKSTYSIKISDIHYEIDMSTLGCNSKTLWHDIFIQIIDTISLKKSNCVIILCKCFQEINNELLEIFYSYFQHMNNKLCFGVIIKYIILTEHISFIPENILRSCDCIRVPKPTLNRYKKCFHLSNTETIPNITNIADVYDNKLCVKLEPYQSLCKNIIEIITTQNILPKIKLLKIREYIYDLLVYNLNIHDCCWYILSNLDDEKFSTKRLQMVIIFYKFFHFYNNNYRPIYHFEWLIYSMINLLWN